MGTEHHHAEELEEVPISTVLHLDAEGVLPGLE